MQAVIVTESGEPAQVLRVQDAPRPSPGAGQVLVRMLLSPINPSDLLAIRGNYPSAPPLPFTPGFEGVGVVAGGQGTIAKLLLGRRVALLNRLAGCWREYTVANANEVFPAPLLPQTIADEQAAGLFVNPTTALVLVERILKVPRGAWLLQTAAGSNVGKMVIRLGKLHGFRTINIVRRQATAEALQTLAPDVIINASTEDIHARVMAMTQGQGVGYALDCVGGATGAAVIECLAPGGQMVLFGTLDSQPISLPSRSLMTGSKSIRGFALADYAKTLSPLGKLSLFRRVASLVRTGVLQSDIAATFPLDEVQAAVRAASAPGRSGKVLLRLTPSTLKQSQ